VDQALGRGGLVLLDFWQAACPPCRALEPRLEAFAHQHPGVFTGHRIDVDTDQRTPDRFGVMSIPTLIWLRDGTEATRLDGLIRDADLEDTLARLTAGSARGGRRRTERPVMPDRTPAAGIRQHHAQPPGSGGRPHREAGPSDRRDRVRQGQFKVPPRCMLSRRDA
jgi:thioredoxin 1